MTSRSEEGGERSKKKNKRAFSFFHRLLEFPAGDKFDQTANNTIGEQKFFRSRRKRIESPFKIQRVLG